MLFIFKQKNKQDICVKYLESFLFFVAIPKYICNQIPCVFLTESKKEV